MPTRFMWLLDANMDVHLVSVLKDLVLRATRRGTAGGSPSQTEIWSPSLLLMDSFAYSLATSYSPSPLPVPLSHSPNSPLLSSMFLSSPGINIAIASSPYGRRHQSRLWPAN